MDQQAYSYRAALWGRERRFVLSDDSLAVDDAPPLPLATIRRIRFYIAPGLRVFGAGGGGEVAQSSIRCVVWPAQGRRIALSSQHIAGFTKSEDRATALLPFAEQLIRSVAARNPKAELLAGMPVGVWILWLFVLIVSGLAVVAALFGIGALIAGGGSFNDWYGWLALLVFGGLGLPSTLYVLAQGRPRKLDPATLVN